MSDDYVLPSTDEESRRLEAQASLYGGTAFLRPFLERSPRRVLEVGCGTGFFCRHVAEALPRSEVVGVDVNEERLAFARASADHLNLDFRTGDAFALPFDDDAFDLVYSRFVLAHTTELRGALAEMARVTRPGGTVMAYDMIHDGIWLAPDKPGFAAAFARILAVLRDRGMEPNQGLHLASGLVRAGLEEVRAEVIPHASLAPDPLFETYRKNWIETFRGLGEQLGDELDPALVDNAVGDLESCRPGDLLVELAVLASGTKPV